MFLSKSILIGVGWESIGNLFLEISAADVVCLEEASVPFFLYITSIYFRGKNDTKNGFAGRGTLKYFARGENLYKESEI